MGRVGNLQFIPTAANGVALLPLDQIPQEVMLECEEIYNALKTNDGRMRVQFDSKDELETYLLQVNSYCQQRPEGIIRYRKSPTRGLPDGMAEFRITDPKDEAEEAAADGQSDGEPKRKPGRPRKNRDAAEQ